MVTILGKYMMELSLMDFGIKDIIVTVVPFEEGQSSDYLSSGRKYNTFCWPISGKRSYYVNGEYFEVFPDEVIFIPDGTKYKTVAHRAKGEEYVGIGIVFTIILEDDSYMSLPQDVYHQPCDAKTKELFEKMVAVSSSPPIKLTKLKALLLDLITHLAYEDENQAKNAIQPALDYFSLTYKENLPIQVYAEKCNLSESYFRKLFKEAVGMSPISYRNELRFAEAQRLYSIYRNVGKVAEEVGFCDTVFFTKLYKKRFGTSIKNIAKIV